MIGIRNKNPKDRLEVLKLFLENGQDINAIGRYGWSILHHCAQDVWVKGVKYLMSRETKPDFTIKDSIGSSKVSQFVVKSLRNLYLFEIKRFIGLEVGKRIPKFGSKCSNYSLAMDKR